MSALPHGHITPGHVRAYQAIRSQLYDNITLVSCWINGEPGVAIVMIDQVAEDKIAVMPLFVAITESMELAFEGEGKSRGGGGPKRRNQEFEAAKEALRPGLG